MCYAAEGCCRRGMASGTRPVTKEAYLSPPRYWIEGLRRGTKRPIRRRRLRWVRSAVLRRHALSLLKAISIGLRSHGEWIAARSQAE